jgi:hypothetical protein
VPYSLLAPCLIAYSALSQYPGSECGGCETVSFSKAHDPDACGYTCLDDAGQWVPGVYTRVHRDKSIILAMRGWMGLRTDLPNSKIGLPDRCQAEAFVLTD